MTGLRLMTMNIFGTNGNWEDRRSYLSDGIAELAPDVILLQETILTDGYDQVRELLGEDYTVQHSAARDGAGMGISIASRLPLREVSEFDLQVNERTVDFPCTALLAELESPLGDLAVINYFPSWKLDLEAERQEQALRLIRAIDPIARVPIRHVVIAGDLDADPDSTSIRFLTGRHSLGGVSICFRDAWDSSHPGADGQIAGHTYSPDNGLMREDWPFRRIDYILVRCGEHGGPTLRVTDCRRIFDQPRDGVWASDHFGLVADLESHELSAVPARD
jgi:endonuclease/exonuclease/phosphatase family metal-dependent hydrolase